MFPGREGRVADDISFRREWITKGDQTVFWPLVDFQVKSFDTTIAAALWIVLNPDHTEAVKAGTQKPSNAQVSMTPDQARRLAASLLDAANSLEARKPAGRPMNSYRPWNPLIAGAGVAVIAGVIVGLTLLTNTPHPDNTLLASPAKAAAAGFGFGALIAMFRNWLNERHR